MLRHLAFGALAAASFLVGPADAQVIPPSTLQTLVNAYPWTNGQGLLTGAEMQTLWNTNISVFNTWSVGLPSLGAGVATLLGGASSGTGGPLGSTSPTITSPIFDLGVPEWSTYTDQFLASVFNVGGLPITSFFGGFPPGGFTSGGVTQALVGALDTPSTDTALLEPGGVSGNVNVAVMGSCRTASTVKGCVGLAGVGESNANGVSSFGASINATNFPYGSGTSAGFNAGLVVGMDLTILLNPPSSGSLTSEAEGLRIFGALGTGATAPSGGFFEVELGGTGNASIGWTCAICIDPSPNGSAIAINQAGSASTQASQSINFSDKVSGTVFQAVIFEDQFANFIVSSHSGMLVNVGASTITQVTASGFEIGGGSAITSSGPGGALGNPAFVASSVSKTCGATIVVTNGVVTSC